MGEKCVVMRDGTLERTARVSDERQPVSFISVAISRVIFGFAIYLFYTTNASCNEYNRRISLGSLITCGKEITSTRNIACVALRTKRSCLVGRAR